MEITYLTVHWRFFAKSKENRYYLIAIGKLLPDMADKLPAEWLTRNLLEASARKIEKVGEFNGEVCENIPQLTKMETCNPRVVFAVRFDTMEDLMKYRKEMF